MKNEIKEVTQKKIVITLNEREVNEMLKDLWIIELAYYEELSNETKTFIKYLKKLSD